MRTRDELFALVDALLHDAERAEAGAAFARTMAAQQPGNPEHAKAAAELEAKCARLVADARAVDPDRTALAWEFTTLTIPTTTDEG